MLQPRHEQKIGRICPPPAQAGEQVGKEPPTRPASALFLAAETAFQKELLALIPHLRAFARLACGGRAIAEDMVQETLMKAWRSRGSFQSGTNMKAWLFTILRNSYYTQTRRAWRETHLEPLAVEQIEAPPDEQAFALELSDTARALRELPLYHRESVLLVGVGGMSYKDAATICRTPLGTMKSRVARGRAALAKALDGGRTLPAPSAVRAGDAAADIFAQLASLAPKPLSESARRR